MSDEQFSSHYYSWSAITVNTYSEILLLLVSVDIGLGSRGDWTEFLESSGLRFCLWINSLEGPINFEISLAGFSIISPSFLSIAEFLVPSRLSEISRLFFSVEVVWSITRKMLQTKINRRDPSLLLLNISSSIFIIFLAPLYNFSKGFDVNEFCALSEWKWRASRRFPYTLLSSSRKKTFL